MISWFSIGGQDTLRACHLRFSPGRRTPVGVAQPMEADVDREIAQFHQEASPDQRDGSAYFKDPGGSWSRDSCARAS
jgi:hypothetical protein